MVSVVFRGARRPPQDVRMRQRTASRSLRPQQHGSWGGGGMNPSPDALNLKDMAPLATLILISRRGMKRCIDIIADQFAAACRRFSRQRAQPEIICHSLLGQYALHCLLEGTTAEWFMQEGGRLGGLGARHGRLVGIGGHINSPHV
jgi:hypothetical protein